jgi:hypothetical protein
MRDHDAEEREGAKYVENGDAIAACHGVVGISLHWG